MTIVIMKIAFYSPYLDILGGGERYVLQMANILSSCHQVDVFGAKKLQKKAQDYLGINLAKVRFLPWETSKPQRILKTREYERFFYVTDGSLFISLAQKNFLIVQVPQKSMYSWNLAMQIKLLSWPNVLVYSDYVKNYIDKWWRTKSLIFPPAISIKEFQIGKKENIILSVGRFFPLPHSKKQEVLVEAFKKMGQKGLTGWKLILAGGLDAAGKNYFQQIKKKAEGLPVELYPNARREILLELYSKAKFYWHAAGFGENLEKNPERAEHFGITTIEAMASGCVPLIFPSGGQKEIVEDGKNGLYWQTKEELISKTVHLINNINWEEKLSAKARKKSQEYDVTTFKNKLEELIK